MHSPVDRLKVIRPFRHAYQSGLDSYSSILNLMFYQTISLVGAALILIGYIGLQRGALGRDDRSFNVLNFVGSALLAWVAVVDWRVGFIVLETAWALLSIPGMFRRTKPATS